MSQLIKLFFDICLLRAKPEDLPYSSFLMWFTIITYIGVSLVSSLLQLSFGKAVLVVTVDMAMMLGFTFAGLWIRSFISRWNKTITAIAGTGAIINLVSYLIIMLFPTTEGSEPSMLVYILYNAVVLWYVAVLGHILRSSLSIPLWAGVGIAVLYMYTAIRVFAVLAIA